MDATERFEKFIAYEPMSGCWLWTGARHRKGYGFFAFNGKSVQTHRVSYQLFKGPIPEGMHVLHSCDTPPCVNPDHLRVGTNQENQQEKVKKGRHPGANKMVCDHGHPFTPENSAFRPNGRRFCRECSRISARKQHAKQRALLVKRGVA